MSDPMKRRFTLVSLAFALLAVAAACVAAFVYMTSPLDDETFSSAVAVQSFVGGAVFVVFAAAALCALVIDSLFATWRRTVRLGVRFAAAGLMTAVGVLAGVMLDPASAGLQERFMVLPDAEGGLLRLRAFTPWIDRLAALSWAYAACGAALVLVTTLVVFAPRRGGSGGGAGSAAAGAA
jgi:hypothetical protein